MSRNEKHILQTDRKTDSPKRVNERRPDQQSTTKASGNSNTNPDSPQSEETITATTNQRDEAFNNLIENTGIGIAKAVRIEISNIDCEKENITIADRRERVKLRCQYCRETVSKRHRFCPACSGEITEPVLEKIEQQQKRVVSLDPNTLDSIKEYLEWLRGFSYDGPLLFPFTRQRGQQIVKRMRKLTELKALTQTPETNGGKLE